MSALAVEFVLARLQQQHVRQTGPGRWRACCPAHDGTNPTALSIAEGENGTVLLHCWHGCEVEQVVHALGLELTDLFPEHDVHASRPLRNAWMPPEVFDVARFEVAVVAVIAANMKQGRPVTEVDFARLTMAARRLDEIAGTAYAR